MRRVVLAMGIGLLVGLAGCFGSPGAGDGRTATATPTATAPVVDTHVVDASPHAPALIEGGIDAPGARDDYTARYYATSVGEEEAATAGFNRSELGEAGRTFVDETDFGAASLVVVQTYPQSSVPDYRVERARRSGGTLSLHLNDSSPGGTDDVTVETLLVRVQGETPLTVAVTADDGTSWTSDQGIVTETPTQTVGGVPAPG